VREDGASIDIDLIRDRDIVTQDSHVLQTSPFADRAVPSNDGGLDPSVVLDLAVLQEDATLETNAIADDDIRADDDVGADATVLADLRGRVDQDITAVHIRLLGKLLRAALRKRRKVKAGAAEEVLWLSNVHPETLEVERVELAILDHRGEGLLLDRGGAQLDTLQDAGVEDIDAGIDAVADELDRLLDEPVDARGVVGLVDDDTILGWLLHLGHHDRALVPVLLVELCQLLEGVLADDVGVENEEGRVILGQDLLRKLQGARRTQRLRLDGELDFHVVLLLILIGSPATSAIGRADEESARDVPS